ncbi:unnamed protein product [Adineta ricciae]|uniref:EGF-like domain-containing protein n=1 Tax=Adineta ricciae TaxID=249248 RepID=A0A814ZC88_ADIRI|nr:unnamed protein product [Adineta ricciae]
MKLVVNTIVFFSLISTINAQANCTIHNPCGSGGYCSESGENYTCQCKYWLEGQFCDRQSNSGKEMIVLGSLTGLLIVVYYGLRIGRKIYLKRKAPKQEKVKKISTEPKLKEIFVIHAKKTFTSKTTAVAVLVILIAVATLLIRWSLVKNIHSEVVTRFEHDGSAYFDSASVCDLFNMEYVNVITIPAAVLVIIICAVINQRASFKRDKCKGYGAPPMPLDFFSHIDRKFAMVIFALISNDLLEILNGDSNTKKLGAGVLVKFLLRVFKVLLMGFRFYPVLASVYTDSIVTLTAATLYFWLHHAIAIVETGKCNLIFYANHEDFEANIDGTKTFLKFFGTGSALTAMEICISIPQALCLAYITVKLPLMLIEKIRVYRQGHMSTEKKVCELLRREESNFLSISHEDSVEMLYVRNLFRSSSERPRTRTLFGRLIPKRIYEWRDDFRHSSRVLCIYSSIFLLLFFVTVRFSVKIIPKLDTLQGSIQNFINSLLGSGETLGDEAAEDTPPAVKLSIILPDLVRTYCFAAALTLTIITIQLIVLLANIRRNLLQAYRGDDSEIPRRQRANYMSYALGNFHFAGYFIGFLVWGSAIIAVFSTIISALIATLITIDSAMFMETIITAVTPGLLIFLFKKYLNLFLAQYVFLQDFGDVLALDNRRYLMIFLYFNFFLDAFLGLVSSILRLIISVVGGILYMCRLDYSTLGRKLEFLDGGFNAYCGFIHTECTHRHPIMLVFVSHLYSEVKKKEYVAMHSDSDVLPIEEKAVQLRKSSRFMRKWRLAAYLVRNPAIVFFRKSFLKNLTLEDLRAINDYDNDDHINTHRNAVLYTRQMAAKRSSFVEDIGLKQIIIQRF